MPDFRFNCPHCEQSLEAPEEMLGDTIKCPACGGSIELPNQTPASPPTPSKAPSRPSQPQPRPPTPPANQSLPPKQKSTGNKVLGWHGIAIGVAVALFIVLIVFSAWYFNPKAQENRSAEQTLPQAAEVNRAVKRTLPQAAEMNRPMEQTSSQAKKELSARLIHEQKYNEYRAKWEGLNALQQMRGSLSGMDSDEVDKAADNCARAMVIEFQKANPPNWITKQRRVFLTTGPEVMELHYKVSPDLSGLCSLCGVRSTPHCADSPPGV